MINKIFFHILRITLGIIFLFSGLIKQNDPLGFSYKLEEYFHVFDINYLLPYAVLLSIVFCAIEITLGIFLLLNIKFKISIRLSLLLLILFGFLTFYSAYFDKVKSCGCFGDVIVLTPWESFIKDLALIIINLIVLYQLDNQNYNNKNKKNTIATIVFISSLALGIYTYLNFPIIDFSKYKIGTNLRELYNNHEIEPLALDNKWNDYTSEILSVKNKKIILITSLNINSLKDNHIKIIKDIYTNALQNNEDIYILSSSSESDNQKFKKKLNNNNIKILFIDSTFLKTLVRTDNGILIIKNGIIINKEILTKHNFNS